METARCTTRCTDRERTTPSPSLIDRVSSSVTQWTSPRNNGGGNGGSEPRPSGRLFSGELRGPGALPHPQAPLNPTLMACTPRSHPRMCTLATTQQIFRQLLTAVSPATSYPLVTLVRIQTRKRRVSSMTLRIRGSGVTIHCRSYSRQSKECAVQE